MHKLRNNKHTYRKPRNHTIAEIDSTDELFILEIILCENIKDDNPSRLKSRTIKL